jgi:hypothetical protein
MDLTFSCDLSVLTAQQRHRHGDLSKKLRPMVCEFQELSNGYVAVIKSSERLDSEIEEFMVLEMLCCPFFALQLQIENTNENEDRMYNLEITGPGDIKPFIRAEFGISQKENAT